MLSGILLLVDHSIQPDLSRMPSPEYARDWPDGYEIVNHNPFIDMENQEVAEFFAKILKDYGYDSKMAQDALLKIPRSSQVSIINLKRKRNTYPNTRKIETNMDIRILEELLIEGVVLLHYSASMIFKGTKIRRLSDGEEFYPHWVYSYGPISLVGGKWSWDLINVHEIIKQEE